MQSLESGSSGMDLSTKFEKEIPSRNLREKKVSRGFVVVVLQERIKHQLVVTMLCRLPPPPFSRRELALS